MIRSRCLLALALAASSAPVMAEGLSFTHGWVFGILYTAGGDTIDELHYTNGTQQNIKAGGSYNFKLGSELRFKEIPLQLQLSLAYHYNNDEASNADARYTRWPVEALAYYNFDKKWRLGGGLHYVTQPKYTYKFENDPQYTFKFEPSLGYVVEGEYFFSSATSVALRYVKVSLPWNYGPYSGKLDGSHWGFGLNIYW